MTEEERCSTVKYAHYLDTLGLKSNSLSSLRNAVAQSSTCFNHVYFQTGQTVSKLFASKIVDLCCKCGDVI